MITWLRTIRQHERGIVERFGKFKKVLDPGLYYLFPSLFDSIVEKIDMRERVLETLFCIPTNEYHRICFIFIQGEETALTARSLSTVMG